MSPDDQHGILSLTTKLSIFGENPTGYWVLGTGCWVLGTGYWVIDAGLFAQIDLDTDYQSYIGE